MSLIAATLVSLVIFVLLPMVVQMGGSELGFAPHQVAQAGFFLQWAIVFVLFRPIWRVIPQVWRKIFSWASSLELVLWVGITILYQLAFLGELAEFLEKQHPYLSWGWSSLLEGHEGGNLLIGFIRALAPPDVRSLADLTVPLVLLSLFAMAILPLMAWAEELFFRRGCYHLWKILPLSVGFGLVHVASGVSLAEAIALSIPGFGLGIMYYVLSRPQRRQGFRQGWKDDPALVACATYHFLYNLVAVSFLCYKIFILPIVATNV